MASVHGTEVMEFESLLFVCNAAQELLELLRGTSNLPQLYNHNLSL